MRNPKQALKSLERCMDVADEIGDEDAYSAARVAATVAMSGQTTCARVPKVPHAPHGSTLDMTSPIMTNCLLAGLY